MASLNLSPEDVQTLEIIRQRLNHVCNSLTTLKNSIRDNRQYQGLLPPSDSLSTTLRMAQSSLKSLTAFLSANAGLLDKITVHPATNFPGRTYEGVLLQLLRKKPEPAVEARLDLGKEKAAQFTDAQWASQHAHWRWANKHWETRINQYIDNESNPNYTVEEAAMGIENVRTGLRRNLPERDAESSQANTPAADAAKGAAQKKVEVEFGLRVGALGGLVMPRNLELESKRTKELVGKGQAK